MEMLMDPDIKVDTLPKCSSCKCFTYDESHPLLQTTPPAHFPLNGQMNVPMKLTVVILKRECKLAHKMCSKGMWSTAGASTWLRTICFNTKTVSKILEPATLSRRLHILENQTRPNRVELPALTDLKREEPELFAPWKPFAVWSRGHDLDIFVHAIMHLLFLGVCKTMAMTVERWCSGRGKRRGFELFCQTLLSRIKPMGLDYCRVEPYTGKKLGGWVSDSYLTLCLLSCWFYGSLYIVTSVPDNVEPTRHNSVWNKKENVA